MSSSLRIIVTGLVAQHPRLGGISWHYLQYVVGLARLGHDVYYLEDSGEYPYNLDGGPSGRDWVARDSAENVAHLAAVMARFGLENRWAFRDAPRSQWFGLCADRRRELIRTADVLINVSGTLEQPFRYRDVPRLIYIDTDPVVTQIKLANGDTEFRTRVDTHDVHFSFGERFSHLVPVTGHAWQPTRQPIVLSEWRPRASSGDAFTTVMNWTSYKPLWYGSRVFGQKDVEFRRFLDLPAQVGPLPMEVALSRTQHLEWEEQNTDGARMTEGPRRATPRELLTRAGWRVVEANDVCDGLDRYRDYIESSRAEWTVAKNAYAQGRPGWFSERSACYLAAGRPVVVQDTGFGEVLPVGEGILTFQTLPEAAAAIDEVETDYSRHAQAARAIAEAYFDSEKVLTHLIDRALTENAQPIGEPQRHSKSELALTSAIRVTTVDSQQPPSEKKLRSARRTLEILRDHLPEHPAVTAWAELRRGRVTPTRIEVLKRSEKGAVYRLIGVGQGDSAVIAKRCRREKAATERTVYEEVLPCLPVTTLHYHGWVAEEDDRFWWLFLEDVGAERYSPFVGGHRAMAARWLGAMHSAAEGLRLKVTLPDRGPNYYLTFLRSARQGIPELRANSSLKSTEQTTLLDILSMCELLEKNWGRVERFCERMPRTFIHGDCLAKNVHVRTTQAGPTLAPFDWAGAGWGLPATDLGQLGLPYRRLPLTNPDYAAYLSSVRDKWPSLDLPLIQQLANLGQMFWSLKVISLGVPEFDHPRVHLESIVEKFCIYKSVLAHTIRSARWDR